MIILEFCHEDTVHCLFVCNVFCKGADMDVCLTNYGHCNYISGKHACIFYDEVRALKCIKCKHKLLCCTTILYHCILKVLLLVDIVNGLHLSFLEYQALWAAQLQRAWDDSGQCPVLVWLLWESIAVSAQRPCGQSPRHHPWVHVIIFLYFIICAVYRV